MDHENRYFPLGECEYRLICNPKGCVVQDLMALAKKKEPNKTELDVLLEFPQNPDCEFISLLIREVAARVDEMHPDTNSASDILR
jgi:hypothetical protein